MKEWYNDPNRYSFWRITGEFILTILVVQVVYHLIMYLDSVYIW